MARELVYACLHGKPAEKNPWSSVARGKGKDVGSEPMQGMQLLEYARDSSLDLPSVAAKE